MYRSITGRSVFEIIRTSNHAADRPRSPSFTCVSPIASSATSLSPIVPRAIPRASTAASGSASVTRNSSFASTVMSGSTVTAIVRCVSPGANVTVPARCA